MNIKKHALALLCCTTIASCGFEAQQEKTGTSPGSSTDLANYISYQGEDIYVNGVNVAWLNYASDFGANSGFDTSNATNLFSQVKAFGGNTVRWWVHTNGTVSPVWSEDGLALGTASEQANIIADMKAALDLAAAQDMYIIYNLWSFDMLAITQESVNSVVDSNYRLLTDNTMRESYVENFIKPLLDEVAGHPALLAIDLFNEPENMTESWFIERESLGQSYPVTIEQIHETTAFLSAGIHEYADSIDKQVLVTSGPKSLGMFNSDAKGGTNYYSDEVMVGYAGSFAPLDFYAPHYYDDMGKEGAWSPFYHRANQWGLDKPIVIGEFFADKDAYKPAEFDYYNDPLSEEELCARIKTYNYAGGLSWQWSNQYKQSTLNCVQAASGVTIEPSGSVLDFEDAGVPAGVSATSETGGVLTLAITDSESRSGSQSLELNIVENHANEKKVYLKLPIEGYDFSTISQVKLSIKLSSSASVSGSGIAGGKFFAKDAGWAWSEGDWVNLPVDEWVDVQWNTNLALPIQELGFQLYGNANGSPVDGKVYFDAGDVN